jgi:hypothetical protein
MSLREYRYCSTAELVSALRTPSRTQTKPLTMGSSISPSDLIKLPSAATSNQKSVLLCCND